MLSHQTECEGARGYVAVDRVAGTPDGRSGSFVLHHRGVMTRGEPHLSVTVTPDSATGDLAGLSGEMQIKIENGKHFYDFDYSLPAKV